MRKGIVARDDSIWQGHPDIALFLGKLFVVFRVSDRHLTFGKTQIHLTSSNILWNGEFNFTEPEVIAQSEDRFNCPRLSVIDGWLYLICDEVDSSVQYIKAENDESKTRVLFWRTNDGMYWEGPIKTNIQGIVPDKIHKIKNGYIIATHTSMCRKLIQNVWYAKYLSDSWSKFCLCHHKELNLCEASISPVDKGYICLMRENSNLGHPAYMAESKDGINWSNVSPTRMFGCHRPVTGMLSSGKLFTTFREASHSFKVGFWAKNTFACLSNPSDLTQSIILPLDHDRNKRSDSGYTGWVELPDESILIVNYITDDAPRPYIRWYLVNQDEF